MNILTVDVEDWYQLTGEQLAGRGQAQPDRVTRQVDRVLGLLANHDCRATFFCLGKSLDGAPHIVRRLADAGHEIATHGWGHEPVHQIGLEQFREDLVRSIKWLEDLLGRSVRGYRAPAFSVPAGLLDGFFDICLEAGLAYDSSVFPIRGRRYGIPEFPLGPTVVRECDGRRLVELPLATLTRWGRRWPVAGGGYWRLLPPPAIHAAVARINREERPVVTYLHPYEFDTKRLDAVGAAGRSGHALRRSFTQNLGRRSIYRKLDSVLSRHYFGAVEDYLGAAGYL
jgi:polysaccharide deacetylase family protein (PEP-CTERM system associated)